MPKNDGKLLDVHPSKYDFHIFHYIKILVIYEWPIPFEAIPKKKNWGRPVARTDLQMETIFDMVLGQNSSNINIAGIYG